MQIALKRVYDPPEDGDGTRILVDRLWPRGINRERARLDLWLKEIAPSDGLRRWFGHEPDKWPEFQRRYRAELKTLGAAVEILREQIAAGPCTLVYAARDPRHNNAVVLRDYLRGKG